MSHGHTLPELRALRAQFGNQKVAKGLPWRWAGPPNEVYGAPASGKSNFLMSLSLHLATGKPFLNYQIETRSNVIYVDYDGNDLVPRADKFLRGYDLEIDDQAYYIAEGCPRIKKADDDEFQPHICQLIKERRETTGIDETVIIFDTMNGLCAGVEENSASIGQYLENLTTIAQSDPKQKVCIVFVHHTGHKGKHERGSTSIRGAIDSAISLEKVGDTYKIQVEKSRFNPKGGHPVLSVRFDDLEFDDDDEPISTKIVLTDTPAQVASEDYTDAIREVLLKSPGMTADDIKTAVHCRKAKVYELLKDCETKNLAEKRGCKWYWTALNGQPAQVIINNVRAVKNAPITIQA